MGCTAPTEAISQRDHSAEGRDCIRLLARSHELPADSSIPAEQSGTEVQREESLTNGKSREATQPNFMLALGHQSVEPRKRTRMVARLDRPPRCPGDAQSSASQQLHCYID